ncbi:hypothetical protein AB0L06_26305 [Spirillospora sp. NPDC052269]
MPGGDTAVTHTVMCRNGRHVLGGGYRVAPESIDLGSSFQALASGPLEPNGWQVTLRHAGALLPVTVYAICAYSD